LLVLLVAKWQFAPRVTAQTESEIPFTFEKGFVIIPAKIRDKIPVEVVLATGAERSLINPSTLRKYELQVYLTGVGIITGRDDRTVTFATVPDLRVGDVKTSSLNMGLGNQSVALVQQRIGREIFGILGSNFFKGRIVQFDFSKRVVRLLNNRPTAPQMTKSKGFSTLRMRASDEPNRLAISGDVTMNGAKLTTLFDTSALTVLSLTPSGAKKIGLDAPGEKAQPREDKLSTLQFGEIEFKDVPITLHAKDSDFDKESKGYAAVVGIAAIQNFIITFDYRDGYIVLERI
jgi:Aspartyl protease